MKAAQKHYKFINSQTSNTVSYHSIGSELSDEQAKVELDKVMEEVAVKNKLPLDIIYWEMDNGDK